jgi:hypothetical protein
LIISLNTITFLQPIALNDVKSVPPSPLMQVDFFYATRVR